MAALLGPHGYWAIATENASTHMPLTFEPLVPQFTFRMNPFNANLFWPFHVLHEAHVSIWAAW